MRTSLAFVAGSSLLLTTPAALSVDPIPGVTYPMIECRTTALHCSSGPVPCYSPGQQCTYCVSQLMHLTCHGFSLFSCKYTGSVAGQCGNIWISYCDEDFVCITHQITDDTCPRNMCEVPSSEG